MSQQADGTQSGLYNGNPSPYNYPSAGEPWNQYDIKHLIDDLDALVLRLGIHTTPDSPFWGAFNTLAERLESMAGGGGLPVATQAEAEAGIVNDKTMTPLRSKQAIDFQRAYASLLEIEAAIDNTKVTTPLRVSESINYKERNIGQRVIDDAKFMTGFNLSFSSTATDIVVSSGSAVVGDSSDVNARQFVSMPQFSDSLLNLNNAVPIVANTFYYVFLATVNSTDRQNPFPSPPVYFISTDAETPTLPVGYDWARFIGAVRTDGASNVMPFRNYTTGNIVKTIYFNSFNDRNVLSGGNAEVITPVDLSSWVPNFVEKGFATLFVEQRTADDLEIYIQGPGVVGQQLALLLDAGNSHRETVITEFYTGNAETVFYQNLSAGANVNINVMGYTYERYLI